MVFTMKLFLLTHQLLSLVLKPLTNHWEPSHSPWAKDPDQSHLKAEAWERWLSPAGQSHHIQAKNRTLPAETAYIEAEDRSHPLLLAWSSWADSAEPHPPGLSISWPAEMDSMAWGGDSSEDTVRMPGGAAEDVPVCLVLGTASVTAIEKKKKKPLTFYCNLGSGYSCSTGSS